MNNEPHVLKLVPIDSKVFFWLLKSAAKHHWYASIKGLVFSLIITSDHPSRLSLKSFFLRFFLGACLTIMGPLGQIVTERRDNWI